MAPPTYQRQDLALVSDVKSPITFLYLDGYSHGYLVFYLQDLFSGWVLLPSLPWPSHSFLLMEVISTSHIQSFVMT
jgi:hypothetical protein